jgi:hypothetical protein
MTRGVSPTISNVHYIIKSGISGPKSVPMACGDSMVLLNEVTRRRIVDASASSLQIRKDEMHRLHA